MLASRMLFTQPGLTLAAMLLWLLLPPWGHASETLRIATFNIAWLADEPLSAAMISQCRAEARAYPDMAHRPTPACRSGLFRSAAAYSELARQVARLDADIIAFQEVQSARALAAILADGRYQQPGSWQWWVNPLPVNARQRVALAVRSSRLGTLQLHALPELGRPLWREQRGGLLARLTLASGRILHLLVVHLKSGCRDGELDSTMACRQLAAQGRILARIIDQEQESGAPLVILGDFNRDFANEQALWSQLDNQQPRGARLQRLTQGFQQPDGCYLARYGADPIDHILLSGPLLDHAVPGSLGTSPLSPDTDRATAKARGALLSDHCPLRVDLRWP